MKGFQKLALVTAIAAAPFAAQAELTAMDDSLLSEMTGQAGVTIDVDLQMSIENIVYVDSDGISSKGAVTLSDIRMGELADQADVDAALAADPSSTLAVGDLNGTASIKGVTIDVDGADGLVIGIGQIGDTSGNGIDISVDSITIGSGGGQLSVYAAEVAEAGAGGDAASIAAAMQAAALAASEGNIGGVVIENFKNYVEDDTVATYNNLFGMAIQDSSGIVDGVTGSSAGSGRYIQAEIKIAGTGNSVLGTSGVQIDAAIGGGMDKMAWVTGEDTDADGFADATHEVGVRDFAFFGSSDFSGDGITDTLEPMEISVTIDVVDHESWNNATPGTVDVAALHISDMVVKGSIQLGDIYMSSTTASVTEQSLGGVLIKNIDMTGTDVYIYGH